VKRVEFAKGDVVFEQGDPSDLCYQIVSGKVEIRIPKASMISAHKEATLESLGFGDIFGEMGIIDDSPRSAAAIAVEPTVCAAYTPDEIVAMLEGNPKEAMEYIRTLIQRLRAANERVSARKG
jgi:CRP/FNR family cyclic AMP-dependent transcriptional regulator